MRIDRDDTASVAPCCPKCGQSCLGEAGESDSHTAPSEGPAFGGDLALFVDHDGMGGDLRGVFDSDSVSKS